MPKCQKEIKLSVVMISYNHENYIRQALESVLKQQVHFEYEILIGDDASTDRTVEIIKEIQEQYPDKIKLFVNEENKGAALNLYNLLMQVEGEYITNLEGDDYWEITEELQKSITFLDNNHNYIGISRGTKTYSEKQEKIIFVSSYPKLKGNIATYKTWRKLKPIGTAIYRNFYKKEKGTDFSVIYKSAKMVAENALGFLMIIRGDVYRTDFTWEIKRGERLETATNYNTIYSQYEIAMELVNSWNVLEEMYPQYDYRYRRKGSLNSLFYVCKQKSEIDVFEKQMSRYSWTYKMYIYFFIYRRYFPENIKKKIMMVLGKIYHILSKRKT